MMDKTLHQLWSEPAIPFDTRLQHKKQFRALVHAAKVGISKMFPILYTRSLAKLERPLQCIAEFVTRSS